MKKPASLREALEAALDARHDIRRNPDRLHMVALDIVTLAREGAGLGFSYRYTLALTLFDFAGEPEEVSVPLLLWIQRWQHDLLGNNARSEQGWSMDVEFLDNAKVDILIRLPLTEDMKFALREDQSGHDVVTVPEPVPMALEHGVSPLHTVYLHDQVVARCTAHPDQG